MSAVIISLVWFIAALALSVAGTFGITLIIVGPAIGGAVWLAYGFLGVATVLLAYSFIDTSRDVKETERALGLDSDGDSHGSSTRMKLWVALITSALIFAPLGVTWLVASQPASTSPFGFVAAIFFIEAVLGAAVGWWAQNRVARHNARLAERVLITGALLGATLAGLAALLGIY